MVTLMLRKRAKALWARFDNSSSFFQGSMKFADVEEKLSFGGKSPLIKFRS